MRPFPDSFESGNGENETSGKIGEIVHTTNTPLLLYSSTLPDSPITPFLPSISGGASPPKVSKREEKGGPSPHPFFPSRNQTRRRSPPPPLFFLHYILQPRDRGRGKRGPVKCEIGPALLAIPPFFVDRPPPSFSIPTTTYTLPTNQCHFLPP